jgi:pyrroloquinoline quinone biosynthesis protein D
MATGTVKWFNAGTEAVRLDGTAVLRFAPHARFRFDEVRQAWVVLAPERLLLPDEQAVEILRLIDGERAVDAIIDELARRFEAPRDVIAGDVLKMLQDLLDKKVLRR